MNLRLRNWRRYLSLPLRDMVAQPPASCTGKYRVAVWLPPGMAPAAVARLLVWHTRYHSALGFSCELVYLYREQLEAALADADVVQLVRRSQLWLVLAEDFLSRYSWGAAGSGSATNLAESAAREFSPAYGDQILVNVHSILASTGQGAWLLSVDIDEYLAFSHRSDVQRMADECFGGQSAELIRVSATCSTCNSSGGELSRWLGAAVQHPLRQYVQRQALETELTEYPEWHIKSILRPDDVSGFGVHSGRLRQGKPLDAHVIARCGVSVLHLTDLFRERHAAKDGDAKITDWHWVLDLV